MALAYSGTARDGRAPRRRQPPVISGVRLRALAPGSGGRLPMPEMPAHPEARPRRMSAMRRPTRGRRT